MTLRAVLFDYGGTLDGPASHWLDRFLLLYRDAGLELDADRFRAAFDHATRAAYADPSLASMDLRGTVAFHVRHHAECLGPAVAARAGQVVDAFVERSRAALAESRALLERLRPHVALAVVSNFYGNIDRILAEAGLAPLLDVIVDSSRVGLRKPDPAIFTLAIRQLGCPPSAALYVGDSFRNDMVGARRAGLRTAWLVGPTAPPCPDPDAVDHRITALAQVADILAGPNGA